MLEEVAVGRPVRSKRAYLPGQVSSYREYTVPGTTYYNDNYAHLHHGGVVGAAGDVAVGAVDAAADVATGAAHAAGDIVGGVTGGLLGY